MRRELAVLRRQVPRPQTTPTDRFVIAFLNSLRPLAERVSSLVSPETLRRWHRLWVNKKFVHPQRYVPRKQIPIEAELLVFRMKRENPQWGYKRIQGELLKIGIKISASSIRRILLDNPGPWIKRSGWAKFMRAQASSIIACDLFTVESLTRKTLHVLFFIELSTRRVFIAGVTDGPASCAWAAEMARNIASTRTGRAVKIHTLVHDRDTRFGPAFDEVFEAEGITILRTPWRTPQANGYAERFIRTVRSELLNRLFILGPKHLERILDVYVDHYNNERPHRGLELLTPTGGHPPPLGRAANGKVVRRDRLGGLIHEYRQQAAA